MKINSLLLILFTGIVFTYSCKSDSTKNGNPDTDGNINPIEKDNPLILKVVNDDTDFKTGDVVKISIEGSRLEANDTVKLYINKEKIVDFYGNQNTIEWNSKDAKTGSNAIEIELLRGDKKFKKQDIVVLFSDLVPENYSYKVKNTYKHDIKSYTQGLFYFEGYLYEATGLKGESTVRKVKPETGEVVQSFAIPSDVFGEGIVKFQDRIVQISWDSNRGFVYDFKTFKLIEEFNYQGEGWGICTDEKYLYMTNGTAQIKILEPQSYSEINSLEVYDDKGPVKYLNELEYINGFIYSNIYQYDKIAKIDPKTGKVVAYIDLKGLLPMNDYTSKTDVLNGIAYDQQKNRIFVTGKNWPKLFEVVFVKK